MTMVLSDKDVEALRRAIRTHANPSSEARSNGEYEAIFKEALVVVCKAILHEQKVKP